MKTVITKLVKGNMLEDKLETESNKDLFIVSGANGNLGKSYVSYIKNNLSCDVISLSRLELDLLDYDSCKKYISDVDLSEYKNIVYVHPVGKFSFERFGVQVDENCDGIDDNVFSSNVITFTNFVSCLKDKLSDKQSLTCVAFGSVSDKYNIRYWLSYTKSKNVLREKLYKSSNDASGFSSVFVNVSTVDTGNENKLRPNPLDKKNWLTTDEVVTCSMPYILTCCGYVEIDVYKKVSGFSDDFYTNDVGVLSRWELQMGNK
ncbi:MAG: hypothetical protein HRU03_07915 [Nanoarchaeales archaeon]|nr:hypothetical protein [Nanoarchaeales archaeon]